MRKRILSILALLLYFIVVAQSQSIWNAGHLQYVRESLAKPTYAVAYKQLLNEADKVLTLEPLSVMMKDKVPASGDKHDYMSQARYFWPDPDNADGLPYISRDGESNPELEKLDRVRLGEFAERVTTLSLAWYFSGDEKYAKKATELLRVWFLNKDTRMNPHLKYAQIIPGVNNNIGRCYGVIDTYSFVEMLDAVQLLEKSKSFTSRDSKNLKDWFGKLTQWILTSEQGQEESRQKNNHSVAHDAQLIAFSMYSGNTEIARRVIEEFPQKRIFTQIEPDGSQPHELRRTLAFGYSQFNISHMLDVFLMAQKVGISIDNATSADGRNFYKAVNFLTPYLGKEVTAWPYEQISEWEYKQNLFGKDLYRIYLFNPKCVEYLQLYKDNRRVNWKDRFNLLYVNTDLVDNAYAFADTQLRYAMKCAEETKKEVTNKKLVSPRTINKDGSLRLVAPWDWCSGFFPGNLWQVYAFTNDDYWRHQAISYTWPIEEIKWNGGTHDLGFMAYNSFGQAWHLTGERSYKDVTLQAAKTLITRYNEKVGAIRSWDHNRDKWQYPVIIDNLMNLELLFWATQETGDSIYYKIAVNHANTTMKNHFRSDYSSYHVVDYDTTTGNVRAKQTHQGIADESSWSRGQAWGLYGYAMCYRFTHNPDYLKQAEKIAEFYFSQPDMPSDLIPYWDMRDPKIPDSPRDASAAAIVASALYELSTYVSGSQQEKYLTYANTILENLSGNYQPQPETEKGFLLLHSTGHYPGGDEIDVPIVYADYYYLEALLRKMGKTNY